MQVLPQLVHRVFELNQSLVVEFFLLYPELLFDEEEGVFVEDFLVVELDFGVEGLIFVVELDDGLVVLLSSEEVD